MPRDELTVPNHLGPENFCLTLSSGIPSWSCWEFSIGAGCPKNFIRSIPWKSGYWTQFIPGRKKPFGWLISFSFSRVQFRGRLVDWCSCLARMFLCSVMYMKIRFLNAFLKTSNPYDPMIGDAFVVIALLDIHSSKLK